MYRLKIFVLASCILVGAIRNGESSFRRSNLFFDSYDRPSLEEFEESEDGLRDAVLMHPEQVLDVQPISVERDYEMALPDTKEPLLEDRAFESVQDSQMARGFFDHLLEQIQTAFSTWPPKLPVPIKPSHTPEYSFQMDDSLLQTQKEQLKLLLMTVEEKTCTNIVEKEDSPQIIFMGVEGCLIGAVENKVIIGTECYEPTMILKLMFKLFGFCATKTRVPKFEENVRSLYLDRHTGKMLREAENDTDCHDKFGFCQLLVQGNSSLPCSSLSDSEKAMCARTCRLCGDSCVDYDPGCNTKTTLKDCLLNWDQKKVGCAKTCGLCKDKDLEDSGICADYYPCCEYYAKRGYCKTMLEPMKKYCAPSCGYCKPKSCVDLRTDCSLFEKLEACLIMPDFMEKNCPKTCNSCGNAVENRENSKERRVPGNCSPDEDFVKKYCTWNTFIIE